MERGGVFVCLCVCVEGKAEVICGNLNILQELKQDIIVGRRKG